jgi:hypothetical protein
MKRRNKIIGSMSLLLSTIGWSEELPNSMAALGDSITQAAFAKYPRQDAQKFETLTGMFLDGMLALAGKLKDKDRFHGIEANELSWATGLDKNFRVISHAKRLQYLNPKIKILNAAISGGDSGTVSDKEVLNLRKWSVKNLKKQFPDYVALLVGPNDICGDGKRDPMTEDSVFHERIQRVVDTILTGNKNTKIMISTIPNIASLRDVAKNAPAFRNPTMNTCLKVWERVTFCKNIQLNEDRTVQFKAVERFNQMLRDIAFDANQLNGGDRVRVSEAVYNYSFNADDLAVDCFHPNYIAQNKLADFTFEDTWWSREWNEVSPKAYAEWGIK